MTPYRHFILVAGLCGALAVALSAIAAHRADLPNLGTAAQMLLLHAPAFLALGLMTGNKIRMIASFALLAGIAFFVGDLLALSYLGSRLFPMAAPTGGLLLIAGWLGVAASALTDKKV